MSTAVVSPVFVGRYALFDRIAAGGMATVHVGRLVGEGGFARTVAIKRLHPQFALDPEFVAMFLDEARLTARIRHPNVVPTLDIVAADEQLFLVMEYVEGESLGALLRMARDAETRVPIDIATGVVVQALHGLHAAHEVKNDLGEPLDLVHRDVSPQNILVGTDGVARVLDFGVAKALGKLHTTREGQLKGKLGYLAPEQVLGHPVTRRSDVFAAAVVLWEAIAGRRLFDADSEGDVLRRIMDGVIPRLSETARDTPPGLDDVVMRALSKEPANRFDTALAMAAAVEAATDVATPRAIGAWMRDLAAERLESRAQLVAAIESSTPASTYAMTANAAPPTIPDEREKGATIVSSSLSSRASSSTGELVAAAVRPRRSWRSGAMIVVLAGLVAGSIALARPRHDRVDAVAPAPDPPVGTASRGTAPDAASDVAPAPPPVTSAASGPAPPPSRVPSVAAPRPAGRASRPRAAPSPATGTGLYTRE